MILEGAKAREYMPSLIGDDRAKIISPVKDILFTNEPLGTLILYEGSAFEITGEKKLIARTFTKAQTDIGFIGSFMFIGTNSKFFNQLFNNRFTGKFKKDSLVIDNKYEGLISYEFISTLKNYLIF